MYVMLFAILLTNPVLDRFEKMFPATQKFDSRKIAFDCVSKSWFFISNDKSFLKSIGKI
jgi:hypothetical protein